MKKTFWVKYKNDTSGCGWRLSLIGLSKYIIRNVTPDFKSFCLGGFWDFLGPTHTHAQRNTRTIRRNLFSIFKNIFGFFRSLNVDTCNKKFPKKNENNFKEKQILWKTEYNCEECLNNCRSKISKDLQKMKFVAWCYPKYSNNQNLKKIEIVKINVHFLCLITSSYRKYLTSYSGKQYINIYTRTHNPWFLK